MIDPDVLEVLELIAANRRSGHAQNTRNRQHKRLKERWSARLETIIELAVDEVQTIIDPQKQPVAFFGVLAMVVDKKINDLMRPDEEPEFKSDLDHFPGGW